MAKTLSESHRKNIGLGVKKSLKEHGGRNNHPMYLPHSDPRYQKWIKNESRKHKGRKQTPEAIEHRRKAMMGRVVSEKTRELISQAKKGHKVSQATRDKLRRANSGRKHTSSEKRKISVGVKKTFRNLGGHPLHQDKNSQRYQMWQKRQSKAHKGHQHSLQTKEKMSKSRTGKNHPNWQGGISFEPYSVDWTETLRRSVRERDHYTCQICSAQQGDKAFDIHHIDYNKKNCNPKNLITLCMKCHRRTNFRREYWQEKLSKK